MVNFKFLSIVPVDEIPKTIGDCPTTSLVDLYKLCSYMEELCVKEKGIGLSAVQVGVPWKLFVVRYPTCFRYFIDCEYTPLAEEKEKSLEGCLSLKKPDGALRFFEVERFKKIKFHGKELKLSPKLELVDVQEEPTDHYRIVYQHEIDHHRLVLISDIGTELELWKN